MCISNTVHIRSINYTFHYNRSNFNGSLLDEQKIYLAIIQLLLQYVS